MVEFGSLRAVDVLVSRLVAVRESVAWVGGVDVRGLRKVLQDVREGRLVLGEGLGLVRVWERDDTGAFLGGYAHVKGLPDEVLEEHGLVGGLECLRRAVAGGSLSPADAGRLIAALYAAYSLAESYLTAFLSELSEYVSGDPPKLRIPPEDLDKHVIKPLRNGLKAIRPVILSTKFAEGRVCPEF